MENLQFMLILLLSPLAQGIIKKAKALMQGRVGSPVLQSYYDLARLFKKDMVIPRTASWIFHAAPYVVFSSVLTASMLVPVFSTGGLAGFAAGGMGGVFRTGDVIAVIYTLALGRFFMALAGLDAGTAFGGEGASREMTVAILVEPSMMLAIFTAAVASGSTNLAIIARSGSVFYSPAHVLALAAFLVAVIAETGRIPVDNPDTHLELTMIHEGMLLEYSGKYLALMEWAHYMKQMLLFTLAADLFFPYGMAGAGLPAAGSGFGVMAAFGYWAVKMLVLCFGMAFAESTRAKMRFFQLPSLLGAAFVLSALSIITFVMTGR
ncbi:MAG: respiratory chain complex I subunit 1 family protein [Nitrospirota bacterium]